MQRLSILYDVNDIKYNDYMQGKGLNSNTMPEAGTSLCQGSWVIIFTVQIVINEISSTMHSV